MGILEANACGTPAIGFAVPGVREAIKNGQNGLVVPNVEVMIEESIKLLTNLEYRTSLEKGAILRASEFDWDKSAGNLLNLFQHSLRK